MYMCFCHICLVYVVKEVVSFPGLGQLMGVARNRMVSPAAERKLLVAYVETVCSKS